MKIKKCAHFFPVLLAGLAVLLYGFEPTDVIEDQCILQEDRAAQCSGFVSDGAGEARNVILIIGDGMGIGATYAGRVYLNGPDQPLSWEKLPHRGLVTTCAIGGITDSAAAGTAIATGHKTSNGTISQGPDRDSPVYESVLESVKDIRATGLVTTTSLWDATPAVFAAHAPRRAQSRSIAQQMVEVTGPRVMMGGGAGAFTGDGMGPDLVEKARDMGYAVVTDREGLLALDTGSTDRVLGLFSSGPLTCEKEREPDCTEPHLSEMARAAIEVLSRDPRGFFLMIEGARIDHASHGLNVDRLVMEMAEFNRTVELALDWADSHPGTLVVITADHETGGMRVVKRDYEAGDKIKVIWTSAPLYIHANHSSQRVPIYGVGPNAGAIRTEMDNTEVYCVIRNALLAEPAP